jgi:hypothetical protein
MPYSKLTWKYKVTWRDMFRWVKKYAPWALDRLKKLKAAYSCGPNRQINLIGKGILILCDEHGNRHSVAYENGKIFDSYDGVIHKSLHPIYKRWKHKIEAKIPMTGGRA